MERIVRANKSGKAEKMAEKRKSKNIKSYHSLKSRAVTGGWVTKIPLAATRSNARNILGYAGIGEVEIPGSFLAEASSITNLPALHLAEVLDMSKTSYYRALKEDGLEMETIDKLSSLFKIYEKGTEAFENQEAFEEWLNSKVTNLGDQKPVDLIKTESGRATVLDAIYRVEFGIYG